MARKEWRKNENLIIFFFHNSRSFDEAFAERNERQKSVYSLLNLNINFHLCNRLLHDDKKRCTLRERKRKYGGKRVEKEILQEERWDNKEKLCCTRLSRERKLHRFSAMPQLMKHRNKLENGAFGRKAVMSISLTNRQWFFKKIKFFSAMHFDLPKIVT